MKTRGMKWKRLGLACVVAFGFMAGDLAFRWGQSFLAFGAFNDLFPCGSIFADAEATMDGYTQDFQIYQCEGGVLTMVQSGTCTVNQGGGNCGNISGWACVGSGGYSSTGTCENIGGGFSISLAGDSPPPGWSPTGTGVPSGYATVGGSCNCSDGLCHGMCNWQYIAGTGWVLSESNCSAGVEGCNCAVGPTGEGMPGDTTATPCGSGTPTCSGTCHYTGVAGESHNVWELTSNDCAAVTGCTCPDQPADGPCPEIGDTTTIACGATGGSGCSISCTGSCSYTSVSDGAGGWVWSFVSSTCTTGLSGCGCPSSPGGSCPTESGQNTNLACGSSGGPCNPGPCTGNCDYVSIAGTEDGTFVWSLSGNNCRAGATDCTCPADPGGECPTDLRQTKSVACGSASVACTKANCVAHGGDADNDGCCKDKDVDDSDASVCSGQCAGTYTKCQICQRVDPADSEHMILCDPNDPDESIRAACRCAACVPSAENADCLCGNVANGDKDKDSCCDSADKWPDDPKRGCECCDYEKAWLDNGGAELRAEWYRIFGASVPRAGSTAPPVAFGPVSQFVAWNSSTNQWESTGPSGDPSAISFTVPMWRVGGGYGSDIAVSVPVTLPQIESLATSTGAGDFTGSLSGVDTFRSWFRAACGFVFALQLLGVLLQEFRV